MIPVVLDLIKICSVIYNPFFKSFFCLQMTVNSIKQSIIIIVYLMNNWQKDESKEAGLGKGARHDTQPVHQNKDDTVSVNILAKPGARQNAITGKTLSCYCSSALTDLDLILVLQYLLWLHLIYWERFQTPLKNIYQNLHIAFSINMRFNITL